MNLTHPAGVMARLEEIDRDLAVRQNTLEAAARAWFVAKRQKEHDRAVKFLSGDGTVAERTALAERETALSGSEEEAEFEALKAVVRTLDTRAAVLMSLLKAQSRNGT